MEDKNVLMFNVSDAQRFAAVVAALQQNGVEFDVRNDGQWLIVEVK